MYYLTRTGSSQGFERLSAAAVPVYVVDPWFVVRYREMLYLHVLLSILILS